MRHQKMNNTQKFKKDKQYLKFCTYGFLKNLKFFEPFLILYFLEAGISFLQIGFLFTIQAVSVNLLEIPSGMIADGIGRRKSMLLSFTAYIASFLMFYFLPYYIFFIPAMLLFAFGDAFRTGTHKAMILDYLKVKGWTDAKIYYYGHTRSWSQRGSAVSALIAAGLVFYAGSYRPVFLFTLIPYVSELVLMLSYPKWLDGISQEKDHPSLRVLFMTIAKEMLTGLKKGDLRRAFLSSSLPAGFFESMKDYIQPLLAVFTISIPFLTQFNPEQSTAITSGITYSFIFLFTSIASGISGHLSSKLGPLKRQMNGSYLLMMLIIAGAGLLYHLGLFLPAVFCFMAVYFIQNFRRPLAVGYLSDQIDNRYMATGLSTDSQLKTLWIAIAAPIIGFTADRFTPGTALIVIGVWGTLLYPFSSVKK